MAEHDDRQGENQVRDAASEIVCLSHVVSARAWKNAQAHSEDENEHEGHPELRNAARDGSNFAQRTVKPFVFMPRAKNAEAESKEKRKKEANAAEAQRKRKPCPDDLQHVHFVFIRDTELAAKRSLQPKGVLPQNRLVETESCFGGRALGGLQLFGALAIKGDERVSGGQARDNEYEKRQDQHAHKKNGDGLRGFAGNAFCVQASSPPSVRTKWPGETSRITPCARSVSASNVTSFRLRSRMGSGSGMAERSAFV